MSFKKKIVVNKNQLVLSNTSFGRIFGVNINLCTADITKSSNGDVANTNKLLPQFWDLVDLIHNTHSFLKKKRCVEIILLQHILEIIHDT